MAETRYPPGVPDVPEAIAAPPSRRRVQAVWVVPVVAALIGGWLAVKSVLDRGPTIKVTFDTAEGVEAGKTKIKFKDVDVGLVQSVTLSEDAKHVVAIAEMIKPATRFLVDDTRFWIVRPRISGGTVSGLGTLLSGSYIGMDAGTSASEKREFTGLKIPPVINSDVPGREFVLHAVNIGSLDHGAPVFFRRLQVGQVSAYELDKDGKGLTFKVFVNAPYDRFVNANTRFWHASGVDLALDSTGLKIQTESVVAVLVGGLAFETPETAELMPAADASSEFTLFANRAAALKNPEPEILKMMVVFRESVRGLAPGASVDFRGIPIGEVASIKVVFDEATKQMNLPVEINLYPSRLRSRQLKPNTVYTEEQRKALLTGMIARGMRAQLRSGNLLTGQLYIALDFFPNAPKVRPEIVDNLAVLPVMPSTMTELQATIASIAKKVQDLDLKQLGDDMHQTLVKVQSVQFDRLGDDIHRTLANADKMIVRLDGVVDGEGKAVLVEARKALASADRALKPDSPLSQDAREAMRELARTAQSFRMLADYLERHPESLVMGKKEDGQ